MHSRTYTSEDLEVVNVGLLGREDFCGHFVSMENHGHWKRYKMSNVSFLTASNR